MKHIFLIFSFIGGFSLVLYSQSQNEFPQNTVNQILQQAFNQPLDLSHSLANQASCQNLSDYFIAAEKSKSAAFSFRTNSANSVQSLDTLIVGAVPNDTVRITGNWTHEGPIYIFNDGVLIFDNANVIDTGDVYVLGTGKILADSSNFVFPQNYFYERSMLLLQNSFAQFTNCSFNYSGMSHGLTIAHNAQLIWDNVHQNDWTTCGLGGTATLTVHGCNITGEFILSDSSNSSFVHADSLILWHHFPQTSVINYAFPSGNPVYNYSFDNSVSGITGINYHTDADSCNNVWWALMPENGSDVTLSNSTIRLIGAWFRYGDTTSVYGIFNNSNYTNYIAPMADRNLHLINSTVETWSMYIFDSSSVAIDSCQFGEVGSFGRSTVLANRLTVDGTGGYFFSSDSSLTYAVNSIATLARSERKSLFLLAYSYHPFLPPTSINTSTFVCLQNILPSDPVPYNSSVMWMGAIENPDTASVNAVFAVNGSAWIDQGPDGNTMDFGSYSLYYQFPSQSQSWFSITQNQLTEVRHTSLANWNTNGLTPGTYVLRLVLKNSWGDSVDCQKIVELLPNPVGMAEYNSNAFYVYPNPLQNSFVFNTSNTNGELIIYNALGDIVKTTTVFNYQTVVTTEELASGIYTWMYFTAEQKPINGKIVKE
jgi:hypothetical protein